MRTSSEPKPTAPSEQSDEALLFQLFNEIGIIDQLAGAAFERVLPYALTRAQFTVLNHCVRLGDNRTPGQIASALQVTPGTLTSTLARLEAKDFITIAPDPDDGRAKRVKLTKKGRAAREDCIKAAGPLLARTQAGVMKAGLSRAEVTQLLTHLEALRRWLDQDRDG